MSYKKANDVLPYSLLNEIQQYIDGEYLYIPRRDKNKLPWGTNTQTRETLQARNKEILAKYDAGSSARELAKQYFLSTKTIYKILNTEKNG